MSYLGDDDSDNSQNLPPICSPIRSEGSMNEDEVNLWLDDEDSSPGKFGFIYPFFGVRLVLFVV